MSDTTPPLWETALGALWIELGEPAPPEWLAYRQALRDVTKQRDPEAIDWPEAP